MIKAIYPTGHTNERIVSAVKEQLDLFSHVSFQVTPYTAYVELAEKLNALAPGSTPKKSLLVTTGSEAVENAVNLSGGQRQINVFRRHGNGLDTNLAQHLGTSTHGPDFHLAHVINASDRPLA